MLTDLMYKDEIKRQARSIYLEQGGQNMQARALLMIEHRLIERMINLIDRTLTKVESTGRIDPVFVDTAVDFIRVYADRTHHGKEEDILFRDLEKRPLSDGDQRLMRELIDEHTYGRRLTRNLAEANKRYRNGDQSALPEIIESLKTLIDFYPRHIEKEDKKFFPAARSYITDSEDQTMLEAFREFDRKMIHEKYVTTIEAMEAD